MTISEQRIIQKYVWFIQRGWQLPTLNDPRVIRGTATPTEVDALIERMMLEDEKRPIERDDSTPSAA